MFQGKHGPQQGCETVWEKTSVWWQWWNMLEFRSGNLPIVLEFNDNGPWGLKCVAFIDIIKILLCVMVIYMSILICCSRVMWKGGNYRIFFSSVVGNNWHKRGDVKGHIILFILQSDLTLT